MNLAEIKAAAEESLAHTWAGGEIPVGPSIAGAYQDAVRAEKANARNVLWLVERVEELAEALESTATELHEAADAWPTPNRHTEVADRARAALARLEEK